MRLFGFMFKLYCASVSLFFSQTQGILQASPLLLNFLISLFFCLVLHQTCFFHCMWIHFWTALACMPCCTCFTNNFWKIIQCHEMMCLLHDILFDFLFRKPPDKLGFFIAIFHKDWALLMLEMSTVQWLFSFSGILLKHPAWDADLLWEKCWWDGHFWRYYHHSESFSKLRIVLPVSIVLYIWLIEIYR